jgi:inosose dehydratase
MNSSQIGLTRRSALSRFGQAMAALFASAWMPPMSYGDSGGYHPIFGVESYIWLEKFQMDHQSLKAGIPEMCAGFRRAGFRNVEMDSDFLTPDLRSETLGQLKLNNLQLLSVYANSTMHKASEAEKSITDILDLARSLASSGLQAVVTDPAPKADHKRKSHAELALQCHSLDTLGAQLRELGIRLMIHHHTPELADHAREWHYELKHTDPDLVFCVVDVDWAMRGGQQVLPFIQACGKRLASLHLRNDRNGVWMESFGPGDIDYLPIARYLRRIQYQGFLIVELAYEEKTKITHPLVEDLRLSRLYTQKTFRI